MRTRFLRRLLDLIAEPPRVYTGRHTTRTPIPTRIGGFAVEAWVWDTWADIAARHGIEDQP